MNGIYYWECRISFNASVLQAVDAKEGPFLQENSNPPHNKTIWGLPSIDNYNGNISISCGLYDYLLLEHGAVGDGVLANVTFQAVGEGSSPLNFSNTLLNTYIGGNIYNIPHDTTDGSVTVEPAHDVAVVSVTAPAEAASESSVPIDVTVKNEGSFTENVNVKIYRNETLIDSKDVTSLAAGTQNTTTFTWSTTGVSKGNYTLNATATISVDNDPTDNFKTTTIRIVEHDVAVINLKAPEYAHLGDSVPINVTAKNQGSYEETVDITIYRNETYIDSKQVTLASGISTNTSFTWDTTSLTTALYIINATAIIPTIPVDDDPTDNSMTKKVTLKLYHDVAIIDLEVPTLAHLGDTIPINVTVKNEGDYEEKVNITVRYYGIYNSSTIGSENVTLTQGQNKTANFTWSTTGLMPGFYTIKANASIPGDDDLGDNFVSDSVFLRTHDVKVTSITAPSHGYRNSSVPISVTVRNEGQYREAVNVTLQYDTVLIGFNDTIELGMGSNITVSFTWYTTSLTLGNYNLTANATVLPSDTNAAGIDDDPGDNTLDDVTVFITIPGDSNGDGTVDDLDLSELNEAYGHELGDPNWTTYAYCDFKGDNKVDALDLFDLSKNYGKTV